MALIAGRRHAGVGEHHFEVSAVDDELRQEHAILRHIGPKGESEVCQIA